jgi:hypothetical protein
MNTPPTLNKYACPKCGAVYWLQSNLYELMRQVHHEDALEATDRLPVLTQAVPATLPAAAVEAVKGEMRLMIQGAVADLKASIEAQNSLLKGIDVPLEAIADSHERATESFETLRKDISEQVIESPALKQIAASLDAAGLADLVRGANLKHERILQTLEARLLDVSADMVKIVHLLERMQARELREAKAKLKRKRHRRPDYFDGLPPGMDIEDQVQADPATWELFEYKPKRKKRAVQLPARKDRRRPAAHKAKPSKVGRPLARKRS